MKTVLRMFFFVLVIVLVVGCGEKKSGIEGKLVDGKGQPMSGVKVIAKQVQPIKGYEQFETTTGADGSFKLKGLYPASGYVISPASNNWKTSVKVTAQSGPAGQTSMLPSPMTVRFTISNEDIISDSASGLEWVPAPGQFMNWFQAQNYAQTLSLGGGGWRLPTRSELISIYDKAMEYGADPAFRTHGGWVWTVEAPEPSSAYRSDFYLGSPMLGARRFRAHPGSLALAVRSRR